ncbi:4Fe-4S dicluster domain-containing protein [Dethiosulfatarculus sandiegensis]|uniref:4Fe-4S ferredoxin n=1 Tax=Dethiosulfatarculus sandiegensis TaxID=1429043 RepID=A0A0D2JHN2_9BACT|nr:4Fe-4S dicluster domain-containing protein [Dethiosulfatarculus sandiegensis]KIX15266.1 4Fe-4S ferredoxin [Dethiosulfatarculus sandiegensis]
MPKSISRRSFLKGGVAAAATAAASTVAMPQAVQAADGTELCTLFDLEKCVGCEECVYACREEWQSSVPDPVKPMPKPFPERVPIEDWSNKKDVRDRLTPYNFLYIEFLEIEHKGEVMELNVPRRCMHCLNPPCTNLCPFGAGRVEKSGIVHIDKDLCLGGSKCKKVCPWHIPQRQSGVGLYLDLMPRFAGNGAMFKCHRCLPLVEKGEKPRCVEVCPEEVQSIGTREQILAQAKDLAMKKAKADGASSSKWREYVYGMAENGGTGTIYVSPIPFDKVNQALMAQHEKTNSKIKAKAKKAGKRIPKGNLGRPHMKRVENSMENPENLGWALLLAPVAGLAAGFNKIFAKTADKPKPDPDSSRTTESQGGQS